MNQGGEYVSLLASDYIIDDWRFMNRHKHWPGAKVPPIFPGLYLAKMINKLIMEALTTEYYSYSIIFSIEQTRRTQNTQTTPNTSWRRINKTSISNLLWPGWVPLF